MLVRAFPQFLKASDHRRTAFERLLERERSRLFRLLTHISGDREAAEDLAQEVSVRAWQAYDGFRGEASERTWLTRIAINAALRWRERQTRQGERLCFETVALTLAATGATPEEAALLSETSERTRLALDALPDELRTPLLLHAWEGMKYREIAETMEIPVGTVMSRLNTARKRMRRMLGESLDETATGKHDFPAGKPGFPRGDADAL